MTAPLQVFFGVLLFATFVVVVLAIILVHISRLWDRRVGELREAIGRTSDRVQRVLDDLSTMRSRLVRMQIAADDLLKHLEQRAEAERRQAQVDLERARFEDQTRQLQEPPKDA